MRPIREQRIWISEVLTRAGSYDGADSPKIQTPETGSQSASGSTRLSCNRVDFRCFLCCSSIRRSICRSLGSQDSGWVVPWTLRTAGRPQDVYHDGSSLFAGLPQPSRMVRYNSLVVDPPAGHAGGAKTYRSVDLATRSVMAYRHDMLQFDYV